MKMKGERNGQREADIKWHRNIENMQRRDHSMKYKHEMINARKHGNEKRNERNQW